MNQVATQNRSPLVLFKEDLARLEKAGELALPGTVPFKNFRNAAIVAVTDNPQILQCGKDSVFKAIRTLAGAGLVPDGREAAIVPFKGQATAMPMVAGLIKVARNSGKITSLWAEVVYEDETFTMIVDDGERRFDHNYDPMNRQGGKVKGAYAVAKLTDGTIEIETMGRADIEKRRRASANQKGDQPTGIWAQWYEEMAKKTIIRALCKRLPMSTEDMERLHREQEPLLKDVTPEPEAERPNLAQRLQKPPQEPDQPLDGEIMPEDEEPHWTAALDASGGAPGSDAFAAGVSARGDGQPREACPFDGDEESAVDWLYGWDQENKRRADDGETDES